MMAVRRRGEEESRRREEEVRRKAEENRRREAEQLAAQGRKSASEHSGPSTRADLKKTMAAPRAQDDYEDRFKKIITNELGREREINKMPLEGTQGRGGVRPPSPGKPRGPFSDPRELQDPRGPPLDPRALMDPRDPRALIDPRALMDHRTRIDPRTLMDPRGPPPDHRGPTLDNRGLQLDHRVPPDPRMGPGRPPAQDPRLMSPQDPRA